MDGKLVTVTGVCVCVCVEERGCLYTMDKSESQCLKSNKASVFLFQGKSLLCDYFSVKEHC